VPSIIDFLANISCEYKFILEAGLAKDTLQVISQSLIGVHFSSGLEHTIVIMIKLTVDLFLQLSYMSIT
jgi:hypothetical protein